MLCVHLFGNPQILDGTVLLPRPAPNKVFVLLAWLLLKGQLPVSRDHLAYVLWPDAGESEARANLRRHLHLLRKQLPPAPSNVPWILSARQTLQWNPDADYRLDAAILNTFNPQTAGEADWQALVTAYRGDLLEGFYDDWILTERAHLRQRYAQLLEHRLAEQEQQQDAPGAINTARRLLLLDPLREEACRKLMKLLYLTGDRAAALREFEKCRALLQNELNVAPMPETLALRDAISDEQKGAFGETPADRLTPSPLSAAPPNTADPVFSVNASPPLPQKPNPSVASFRRRRVWAAMLILFVLVLTGGGLWAAGFRMSNSPQIRQTRILSGPEVTQDTWIDKDNPNLLYDPDDPQQTLKADYQQVHLMFWDFPYDRVLIQFDLKSLPPAAKIEQAVFYQHLDVYTNENLPEPLPATISAFRLLRPWQAKSATYNAPWSQPGLAADVDYDSIPLGSQAFHGETWFKVDITPLAQIWAARPEENFGLMLMLTEAPRGAHYWVDTANHHQPSRRPRLELTYTLKN